MTAVFEFFLSSLFPHKCLVCGTYNGLREGFSGKPGKLCDVCAKDFVFLSRDEVCSACGRPLPGNKTGGVCGFCVKNKNSFSVARSVVFFSGTAAESVKRFKYGGDFPMGDFLSSLVLDFFPSDFGAFDVVVPVPLHLERLRSREFNQSCFISSKLALALKKDYAPFVLQRVRNTQPQTSLLKRKERKSNVRGAFCVRESEREKIKGKKVMVFDDIFTTGSTVEECSSVLISSGADKVKALTVFRTPF